MRYLAAYVRLHDGRFHGAGMWPPSPARLFQALVAGGGLGGPLAENHRSALEWLETLQAPVIGAPRSLKGEKVTMYVPGNDLDGVGGDLKRTSEIRDLKMVTPRLFDATVPFIYAWGFEDIDGAWHAANRISSLAERLYQFGRGVDMAWAWAEVLHRDAFDERIIGYQGNVFRPSRVPRADALDCPCRGSLKSLEARYASYSRRFAVGGRGQAQTQVFSKPPAARFVPVPYDHSPVRHLYELRERSSDAPFAPWAATLISALVTCLRDAAVDRLCRTLPSQSAQIERVIVGRKPEGPNDGPPSARVRIIPLPSIGHPHADRGIRRVLVEVSPDCPLRADDVRWAFSGLTLVDPDTGEVSNVVRTPTHGAPARSMRHYGIGEEALYLRWRTVSPVALPIDSSGRGQTGGERMNRMAHAANAVRQALRHAGIGPQPTWLRVQGEPFESGGERAEAFAAGTRFGRKRLWHVEIAFCEGVAGPLVIGDGRFLGLGLMAPEPGSRIEVNDDPA